MFDLSGFFKDKFSVLRCENKKCNNKLLIKTKWIKNAENCDKCGKKWVKQK